MTPSERLMDALGDTVSASAHYGMNFDGTAPVVLQLGIKLSQKVIGKEALIIVLRRIADDLAGPTQMNVVEMFPAPK